MVEVVSWMGPSVGQGERGEQGEQSTKVGWSGEDGDWERRFWKR